MLAPERSSTSLLERAPHSRRAVAVDELLPERVPEVGEVVALLGVLREVLIAVQSGVKLARVQRGVDGGEPHRAAGARVRERALHRRADRAVDGAEEEHSDVLAVETVLHQCGIADLEQLLGGACCVAR